MECEKQNSFPSIFTKDAPIPAHLVAAPFGHSNPVGWLSSLRFGSLRKIRSRPLQLHLSTPCICTGLVA
jgi:hypothetical protein